MFVKVDLYIISGSQSYHSVVSKPITETNSLSSEFTVFKIYMRFEELDFVRKKTFVHFLMYGVFPDFPDFHLGFNRSVFTL